MRNIKYYNKNIKTLVWGPKAYAIGPHRVYAIGPHLDQRRKIDRYFSKAVFMFLRRM